MGRLQPRSVGRLLHVEKLEEDNAVVSIRVCREGVAVGVLGNVDLALVGHDLANPDDGRFASAVGNGGNVVGRVVEGRHGGGSGSSEENGLWCFDGSG